MCKADMIHCAPRMSDSLNDSLCQSQPDKNWVLREAPTREPSALSQSSLLAGRLIWDKVVMMCLLQISQDNQCHLLLEQQPSGWLLSLPSSFFETFQQCPPTPTDCCQIFLTFTETTKPPSRYSKRNPPNRTKKTPKTEKNARRKRDSWEGLWMMDRLVRSKEELNRKFTGMQMLMRAKGFTKLFQSKAWPLLRCAMG